MSKAIDYGTAIYEGITIKMTEEASPTNVPGNAGAWQARGVGDDGGRYKVVWVFDAAEQAQAGDDASELPWDDDHIDSIQRID